MKKPAKSKKRVSIRVSITWLLLGLCSVILLLPVMAVLSLSVYQNHLVRKTEKSLISQSVIIGEAWRSAWLKQKGQKDEYTYSIKSPLKQNEHYTPITPVINLRRGLGESLKQLPEVTVQGRGASYEAARGLSSLLERSQVFNLSSVSLLDKKGCVLVSTGPWEGTCMADVKEIKSALGGKYFATPRQRISDEARPPLSSISRGGDIRVFTATPVFHNKNVVAVVWMSRTSMAPLKDLWINRRALVAGFLSTIFISLLLVFIIARSIIRPLKQITKSASIVAEGKKEEDLKPFGFAPNEIHVLGDGLSKMRSQLTDRAKYIEEFAADISHELKSPITAITGAVELLLDEAENMDEKSRIKFLNNIKFDSKKLEQLVSQHLRLARIQADPESAENIIVESFLSKLVDRYDYPVESEIEDSVLNVSMNLYHLESAIDNLVQNAIRYSTAPPVKIRVKATDIKKVEFSVVNSGEQIDDELKQRLFDRFFTTEKNNGGDGLGLAIVDAVAKTRGTKVKVTSTKTETCFSIEV